MPETSPPPTASIRVRLARIAFLLLLIVVVPAFLLTFGASPPLGIAVLGLATLGLVSTFRTVKREPVSSQAGAAAQSEAQILAQPLVATLPLDPASSSEPAPAVVNVTLAVRPRPAATPTAAPRRGWIAAAVLVAAVVVVGVVLTALNRPSDAPGAQTAAVAAQGGNASAPGRAATSGPRSMTLEWMGQPVTVNHPPTDIGRAVDMVDGSETTPMRGASDNPFPFDVQFSSPIDISTVELVLGYMPDWEVRVTLTGASGQSTAMSMTGKGDPLSYVRATLSTPDGKPVRTGKLSVWINDIRSIAPAEWHHHVYELRVR